MTASSPDRISVTEQHERVRRIALALPAVTERASHSCPTFFINDKKSFVMCVDNHHGDAIVGLWCAAPPGDQALRIDEDPEHFFRPPYVGARGWVGVRLITARGADVPDDVLVELVTEAWRCVAPKRLLSSFDSTFG